MKITIRKKHLKLAQEVANTRCDRTQHCVVAQAIKQLVPTFHFCGIKAFYTKEKVAYLLPPNVRKVIRAFDKQDYDKVAGFLPLTFDARTRA